MGSKINILNYIIKNGEDIKEYYEFSDLLKIFDDDYESLILFLDTNDQVNLLEENELIQYTVYRDLYLKTEDQDKKKRIFGKINGDHPER